MNLKQSDTPKSNGSTVIGAALRNGSVKGKDEKNGKRKESVDEGVIFKTP